MIVNFSELTGEEHEKIDECPFQKIGKELEGPKREWSINDVVKQLEKNHNLTRNGLSRAINQSELWTEGKSVFVLAIDDESRKLKWFSGTILSGRIEWVKWYEEEKPDKIYPPEIFCAIYHENGNFTIDYRKNKIYCENGLFEINNPKNLPQPKG